MRVLSSIIYYHQLRQTRTGVIKNPLRVRERELGNSHEKFEHVQHAIQTYIFLLNRKSLFNVKTDG